MNIEEIIKTELSKNAFVYKELNVILMNMKNMQKMVKNQIGDTDEFKEYKELVSRFDNLLSRVREL